MNKTKSQTETERLWKIYFGMRSDRVREIVLASILGATFDVVNDEIIVKYNSYINKASALKLRLLYETERYYDFDMECIKDDYNNIFAMRMANKRIANNVIADFPNQGINSPEQLLGYVMCRISEGRKFDDESEVAGRYMLKESADDLFNVAYKFYEKDKENMQNDNEEKMQDFLTASTYLAGVANKSLEYDYLTDGKKNMHAYKTLMWLLTKIRKSSPRKIDEQFRFVGQNLKAEPSDIMFWQNDRKNLRKAEQKEK